MGTFSFLSGFIKQNFNSNNFEIGVIMTAFGIMALVAGRLSGKVSQKLDEKKLLVWVFFQHLLPI